MREMIAPGVWHDEGPSRARVQANKYMTIGGAIVSARKSPIRLAPPTVVLDVEVRYPAGSVCGVFMPKWRNQSGQAPTGSTCGRPAGHPFDHRLTRQR